MSALGCPENESGAQGSSTELKLEANGEGFRHDLLHENMSKFGACRVGSDLTARSWQHKQVQRHHHHSSLWQQLRRSLALCRLKIGGRWRRTAARSISRSGTCPDPARFLVGFITVYRVESQMRDSSKLQLWPRKEKTKRASALPLWNCLSLSTLEFDETTLKLVALQDRVELFDLPKLETSQKNQHPIRCPETGVGFLTACFTRFVGQPGQSARPRQPMVNLQRPHGIPARGRGLFVS